MTWFTKTAQSWYRNIKSALWDDTVVTWDDTSYQWDARSTTWENPNNTNWYSEN